MNWEVISQYLPLYQKAMWLTLRIGWMGIAFSIIIGLICALIVHYKIPVARQIVKIYIELFRNTPLLVQLFFIYFGLPKVGLSISADVCGVAGLALLGRQLYGGGVPQRTRGDRADPDGERVKPWHDEEAGA